MTYIPYPRLRVALASARRPLCGVLSLALILSFLATTLPGSSLATSRPAPTPPALTPSLADLPIAFVPNVGQSDPSVHFQAQGLGGMLFFTPAQIVLTLPGSSAESDAQTASTAESPAALKPQIEAAPASERENVVRLSFLGANPSPSISSDEEMSGIVNYMLGNDPSQWHTNVPTYAALRYQQLYPGIDLRYDGEGGRLKGTYLVAAGADPGQIRWHYDGVTDVTVDAEGNLVATLPLAGTAASKAVPTLREAAPIAWQTIDGQQVPVEVRYSIRSDKTIGFVVGAYDRSLPLVLDPTLDYSSYVGSTGDDEGRSIAVDGSSAMYVIGNTNSVSFPDDDESNAGGIDTFITKLDPLANNDLVYTTFLGGSNTDLGSGIVTGAQGRVHLVGSTYSSDFPIPNALDTTLGGETDAFVTTLSVTGTITFSTYLGGTQKDFGNGITVDTAQNIYLTGRTESPDFPMLNARDTTLGGPADAFITKIAAGGTSIMYSTYLGGTRSDTSNAIAVDSAGNAFITGQTSSLDFPTLGSARPPVFAGGITDAFVTKLSSDGRLLTYSIYLGGEEFDEGTSIAVDSERRAYVTGTTQSTTFPTANSFEGVFQGRSDAFFTRINASGSALEYSTFLGGTSEDSGQDIAVDDQNAAYIIGSTKSYDFPSKDAVQSTRNGDIDAFVTKFLPTGSAVEYSTYFGGTIEDYGYGIATRCVSGKCTAYITGAAKSRDFPTIESSWKPNYNGGEFDAFVAQLGPVPTGPRIYVQPPMKFIGVNQIFSVDIMVDSADKDIDTVDAYLSFNSNYLQVVDHQGNPIGAVGSSTEPISPTVDLSEMQVNYNQVKVENGVGQIGFSASKLVDTPDESRVLPRTFTAGTIYFRTLQTTTGVAPTTISFIRQGARRSDLYLGGATRNAALVSSNIRILSGSLFNGKISLEQRGTPPNPKWATPLYRGDNNGIIVYDNWNSANPQTLGFFRTDTDNNGRFSVFLRDIVGDDYDIKIKGADTLSNMQRANLQNTSEIDFGTLCVGDTSGDDVINGADVSYIVPFFPSDDTLPNFPAEGDANKDRRIDREDLNSIKANFLKTGYISETTTLRGCSPPTTRSAATVNEEPAQTAFAPQSRSAAVADKEAAQTAFTPQSSIAATERAVISLYPEELKVVSGQVFTVSLNVDLKSNLADTLDVYLNVDPARLMMVDQSGKELPNGSLQGKVYLHLDALNNTSCEESYNYAEVLTGNIAPALKKAQNNASVTCFKPPFLPNTFTAATFYFKPIFPVQETKITLATEGTTLEDKVRTTNVYKNGAAVDSSRLGATVLPLVKTSFVNIPLVGW